MPDDYNDFELFVKHADYFRQFDSDESQYCEVCGKKFVGSGGFWPKGHDRKLCPSCYISLPKDWFDDPLEQIADDH